MEANLLAADAADAPPSDPEPLTEAQADEVIAAVEEMRKVIRNQQSCLHGWRLENNG